MAIECKMLKGYQAFSKKKMSDHQIQHLSLFELAGGKSFVFLNIRVTEPGKRMNRLIIFKWEWLLKMWEMGSIKKINLEAFLHVEGHKQRYDLTHFLNNIYNEAVA